MIYVQLCRIVHILIILFIVMAPFSNNVCINIIHCMFALLVLMHWIVGSDVCFLTLLESYLTGKDVSEGFVYGFIAPIYNMDVHELNTIMYCVIILSILISFSKIYPHIGVIKTFIQKTYTYNTSHTNMGYKEYLGVIGEQMGDICKC